MSRVVVNKKTSSEGKEFEFKDLENTVEDWKKSFDCKQPAKALFEKDSDINEVHINNLYKHFDERLLSNLTLNAMEYSVYSLVQSCNNLSKKGKEFPTLLKIIHILTTKHKRVLDSLIASNQNVSNSLNFVQIFYIYQSILMDVFGSASKKWDEETISIIQQVSKDFISSQSTTSNDSSNKDTGKDLRKIIFSALSLNELFSSFFSSTPQSAMTMVQSMNTLASTILSTRVTDKCEWATNVFLEVSSRVLEIVSYLLMQQSVTPLFTVSITKELVFLREKYRAMLSHALFSNHQTRIINQEHVIDELIFQYLKSTQGGISRSMISQDMECYGLILDTRVSFKCKFLKSLPEDNTRLLMETIISILRENPSSLLQSIHTIYKAFETEVTNNTLLSNSSSIFDKTKQSFIFSIMWLTFLEYQRENLSRSKFIELLTQFFDIIQKFDIYKMTSENSVPFKFLGGIVYRVFVNMFIFETDSLSFDETKVMMECLRYIINTDYRFLDGYFSYIWKMILKVKPSDIEALNINGFVGDMLNIFVSFSRGRNAFDDMFAAVDMLTKSADINTNFDFPIIQLESFRNNVKNLILNIAPTDIVIYFKYLIEIINKRLDTYNDNLTNKLMVLLVFPLTSFGFHVSLNESNYKKLQKLAKTTCSQIVKRLLNRELDDRNQAAVIQLYYAMSNIIHRSEEFSSDVFSMKEIENSSSEDFLVNFHDGTGYTMSNFGTSGKSFKKVFKKLSFKNKGIFCYIIFRRMMSINQQINIRQHNLITSNQDMYSYETSESRKEQKILMKSFKKYFEFIQNQFNALTQLHHFEMNDFTEEEISSFDWGGFIENIVDEKKYLSMLWYLIASNFLYIVPYCEADYLNNLSRFMISQLVNAIRMKKNKIHSLPFTLERVTLDLWKDDLLFEKKEIQYSFEQFLYEQVSNSVAHVGGLVFNDQKKWSKKLKRLVSKSTLDADISDFTAEKYLFKFLEYFESKILGVTDDKGLDVEIFSSIKSKFSAGAVEDWTSYLSPFINFIPLFPAQYFSSSFALSMFCLLVAYDAMLVLDLCSNSETKTMDCSYPLFGNDKMKCIASIRQVQSILLNLLPSEHLKTVSQSSLIRFYIRTCSAVVTKCPTNPASNLCSLNTLSLVKVLFSQALSEDLSTSSKSVMVSLLHSDVLVKDVTSPAYCLHLKFSNALLSALFSNITAQIKQDASISQLEFPSGAYSVLFDNKIYGDSDFYSSFEKTIVKTWIKKTTDVPAEVFENIIHVVKLLLLASRSKNGLSSSFEPALFHSMYRWLASYFTNTVKHETASFPLKDLIELVSMFGPSSAIESEENDIPIPPSELFVRVVNSIQASMECFEVEDSDDIMEKRVGHKTEGELVLSGMIKSLSNPHRDFLISLMLKQLQEFSSTYSMPLVTVENASQHVNQVETNVKRLIKLIACLQTCLESIQKKDIIFYLCNIIECLKFGTRSYLFNIVPISNINSTNPDYWKINSLTQTLVYRMLKLISFLANEFKTYKLGIPKVSLDMFMSLITDISVSTCIFTYSTPDIACRGKNIFYLSKLSAHELKVMRLDPNIVVMLSGIVETLVKHGILNMSRINLVQGILNSIMNMLFERVVIFDSLLEVKDYRTISSCTQCSESLGSIYNAISNLLSWDQFKAHLVFEFITTLSAVNELVGLDDTDSAEHQYIAKLLATNKKRILDTLIQSGVYNLITSNVVRYKITNWIQDTSNNQMMQNLYSQIIQFNSNDLGL